MSELSGQGRVGALRMTQEKKGEEEVAAGMKSSQAAWDLQEAAGREKSQLQRGP
jgi:hypothetical protein